MIVRLPLVLSHLRYDLKPLLESDLNSRETQEITRRAQQSTDCFRLKLKR